MVYEMAHCIFNAKKLYIAKNGWLFFMFLAWLVMLVFAAYFVGHSLRNMTLLFAIICCADIGAWFFGKMFGGDKMWERLSEHKTWSGQIGGILCGTLMSVIFFLYFKPFGNDAMFAVLLGITISLLSQYGDLTASYIKRCLGIKDFGNLLPGHGGILDRFDGWIYVLPFIWFFIR